MSEGKDIIRFIEGAEREILPMGQLFCSTDLE
jgi:hypothetical protein